MLFDNALQLGDGGIGVLHGQRAHAHQPLGKRARHIGDAVVDELRRFKPGIGIQPVKISDRRR